MRAGGQQRHDVGMLQLGGHQDLTPEPLHGYPSRHLRRQHFDHDPAIEPHLRGHEHAAHSTAAEFALEAVGVADGGLEAVEEVRHGG